MKDQQDAYRTIVKGTSIFGGVQVFTIIISIIRSKFVAVLLGPAGMGIVGLLLSSRDFIYQLTNFGLGTSAVKDIASANSTGNEERITTVVTVVRRLVWITGILGSLIMLSVAPLLSKITFGSREFTFAFVWISITLLLTQLSSGQLVILQGLRKLQHLAKASLAGSGLSLVFVVPLYYLFGIKGIVPAIIVTSVITLLFSWYFAKKVKLLPIQISKSKTLIEGKNMLVLGYTISLSMLMAAGVSYIVRIYISNNGGVDQVGLYAAGFVIINTYAGLLLQAMGTDYYPRLSEVAHSDDLSRNTINQQAEIALLILAPIIMIFIVFIHWVVIILYSDRFIAIDTMIHWASIGMLFKAASWSISFVFLAKGASKIFFWNELIANIYTLGFNVLGYYFKGLSGIGIAILASYFVYLIQVFYVTKIKYNFSFGSAFRRIFAIQILLTVSCFSVVKIIEGPIAYILGIILISLSSWYSYRELNKRIGLRQWYSEISNKLKQK